jgi:hypothetical protein
MSDKWKRVVITIEQKFEAVRRIENSEILRNIASDFGVGISTVSEWVKSNLKNIRLKCQMEGYCNQKTLWEKSSN